MAKLYVDTIEPEGATTNLAIGESGQDVILPGNDIRANVLQDAGGNAIFTSNGSGTLSGLNSGFGDSLVLITTTTVSSAVASIAFTSGLTSTYEEYFFELTNIAPATDDVNLTFQCSTDGGSNYNTTITSTFWECANSEADTNVAPYQNQNDYQGNGTGYQKLALTSGNGSDEDMIGEMHLFNPASTTYVKNFLSRQQIFSYNDYARDSFVSGYFNTASAINAISFKFTSGNIAAGTIKMFGVK